MYKNCYVTQMSVIRFTILLSLNIFYIQLFFHIISCIIFLHLIFIGSSACFMTFSLLHVYLQRKSTLILHTCSCILMTFYTVCMFYFYNLIITCVFVCILTFTATWDHRRSVLVAVLLRYTKHPSLVVLTNSSTTSNYYNHTMSAVTSQSLSMALTVISANIEGLAATKATILSEMCKRECCHCLCLQDTHRSTNLPRPKIAGMSLVVERPHNKYGSAILIRNDLKVRKMYERVQ